MQCAYTFVFMVAFRFARQLCFHAHHLSAKNLSHKVAAAPAIVVWRILCRILYTALLNHMVRQKYTSVNRLNRLARLIRHGFNGFFIPAHPLCRSVLVQPQTIQPPPKRDGFVYWLHGFQNIQSRLFYSAKIFGYRKHETPRSFYLMQPLKFACSNIWCGLPALPRLI